MRRHGIVALVVALVLGAGGTPATAVMAPSGIDPQLRLDWDSAQTGSGRPAVTGYVYNDSHRGASHVQLLVESLDASGKVIDRAFGFIPGTVPLLNRSYFVVGLKTAGASYRVTVTSFEWRDCG